MAHVRTPKLVYLAIGAACSVPRPAGADPAVHTDESAAPEEEAIDVTVRGSTAGAFVSRTSVDRSAREPIDAASLIADLPSVHVRRLGAEGSLATLSVRGSASTQVGVVLAGIPLTSAADPSLDIGALPLWPGASFRVYRGFAPASLGTTGYLGGVLAIDAPSPESGARSEWWTAAGSFGSLKLRVGDARKVGALEIGTGLFASRSDGDFTFHATDPKGGPPTPRERTNAGFVTAGAVGRAALDLGRIRVGATIFVDARRQGLPGPASFPTTLASLETARIVAGIDALRPTERGAWRAAAWVREERSTFRDPLGELDPTRRGALAENEILAAGGSIGWRGRLVDALLVGLLLDGRGERLAPGDESPLQTRAGRLAAGLAGEIEWKPSADLGVTASGRIDGRLDDTVLAGARARTDAPAAKAPPDAGSSGTSADVAPSGHAGVSYRLADAAVLSAHGGALYRPPSFFELFGDRGALLGDPSLRPERALSADAGVHGSIGDGPVTIGYELVAFVTSARDLIAFVPLGRATFRARNVERASITGAEVFAELSARGLRTSLNYTLLATRNLSDASLSRDRPLPGRPMHDLAYDASYRLGPVRVRYSLDALAGTTVDAEGTRVLPARVLHGAGASVDIPWVRGLRASLEVHNLLDLRTLYVSSPLRGISVAMPVSDFLGFPLPGRSVWMTLQLVSKRQP